MPIRGSMDAAGFDVHAAEILRDTEREFWVDTGVAFDIPRGMYGDCRARSSVSEMGMMLANGAGVIDSDYTGTVQFRFYKIGSMAYLDEIDGYERDVFGDGPYPVRAKTYDVGDRVGQIIFKPHYDGPLGHTDDVGTTERGEGGFGSTGK